MFLADLSALSGLNPAGFTVTLNSRESCLSCLCWRACYCQSHTGGMMLAGELVSRGEKAICIFASEAQTKYRTWNCEEDLRGSRCLREDGRLGLVCLSVLGNILLSRPESNRSWRQPCWHGRQPATESANSQFQFQQVAHIYKNTMLVISTKEVCLFA